jgi:hypothetical protein
VKYYGSRGDLGTIFDDATFQMHDVADYAVITNDRRVGWCCMDNRIVLNARARTDDDLAIVTSQYSTRPDCRLGTNLDIANNYSFGMNECSFMNLWYEVA